MSKPDRSTARALKALRHHVSERMSLRDESATARRVAKAQRRERAARRQYLEALRSADLAEA